MRASRSANSWKTHQSNGKISRKQNDAEFVKVTLDDAGEFGQQALSTIICEGDAIGAVILYEKDEKSRMTETESKLAIAAAGFLGKQMEQ